MTVSKPTVFLAVIFLAWSASTGYGQSPKRIKIIAKRLHTTRREPVVLVLKSAVGDWQRSLARLFKIAEVQKASPHRFRHTFAKRLLINGVPMDRVAVLLGHNSPTITMRYYAQWIPERQERLEADIRLVQQKFA